MNKMALLELIDINKRFGDVVALSHIHLTVKPGEFHVLLGPSGCGKSTLLQVIAGLVPQDDGAVKINGHGVDKKSPRDRDVAMVFQNYALYPHMTVAQNLGFALRMRGVKKRAIRKKVIETARLLGIEPLLGRKPKALSGGQRQRVAMGRALVREPSVFLLDEPLSNLDAQLRTHVRMELKKLHQENENTFIHVTHDQVEAMSLGDRISIMDKGRIRQTGTPQAIYDEPADTFVATFVGSPVMNLHKGTLVEKSGEMVFHSRDFSFVLKQLPLSWKNRKVEIGFRPEDIRIGSESTPYIQAQVQMVSYLGAEKQIHARVGQSHMILRGEKEDLVKAGDALSFSIRPGGIHIFDQTKRIGGC